MAKLTQTIRRQIADNPNVAVFYFLLLLMLQLSVVCCISFYYLQYDKRIVNQEKKAE